MGRMVWNRLRYVKDPDSGKRVSRLNPAAEWITTEVPQLRIIDDELWSEVKSRQLAVRTLTAGRQTQFKRARRPKFLFSGLAKCAECGAGCVMFWRDRLACFNARSRGTCTNRRTISRQEIESRVLIALRDKVNAAGPVRRVLSRTTRCGQRTPSGGTSLRSSVTCSKVRHRVF